MDSSDNNVSEDDAKFWARSLRRVTEEQLIALGIGGSLFYTFPAQLLSAVGQWAKSAIDPEFRRRELALGELCDDHATRVGFWNDLDVPYRFLWSLPAPSQTINLPPDWKNKELWKGLASWYDPTKVDALAARLRRMNLISAAYCGWLLTNKQFLQEHDSFFIEFQEPIRQFASRMLAADRSELRSATWAQALRAFCIRWQLDGLAGPYLPVPLQPHIPVIAGALNLVPKLASAGGIFIFFPYTHPVPEPAEIRDLLEGALSRKTTPEHLRKWIGVVAADNRGKNCLGRYERIFRLQHWWRVIQHRHAKSARGQTENLQKAFAVFLLGDDPDDKKFESIRKDFSFISSKLGQSWVHNFDVLNKF